MSDVDVLDYLVSVCTIVQMILPVVIVVILTILFERSARKFHFLNKHIFILVLVLASTLFGIYKWSWNFAGLSAATAFDGSAITDDLVMEFWGHYYIEPFVQKPCYIPNLEKCESWRKHLVSYQFFSNYRSNAYWGAFIFGLISGGLNFLISNSLFLGKTEKNRLSV
jgi:hypothetical protein